MIFVMENPKKRWKNIKTFRVLPIANRKILYIIAW